MNQNVKLHDYQEYAKNFIIKTPKCGLFLDMGMGKSLTTLAALEIIQPAGHILMIAPKNIAKSTWLDEIEKWGINVRTKSLVVNENGKDLKAKKRQQLFEEIWTDEPTMYFINRELIPKLIDSMPMYKNQIVWPFPTVIIDELQSFKSYKAKRFKYMKMIQSQITRFIGLTGTPTPKGLEDLWAEIYLMDGGERLGPNITAYRNKYFTPGLYVDGHPVDYVPLPGAEQAIYDRIKDIVISIENTNLVLPPITYNDIPIYLTESETKLYKKFIKTQVLELTAETKITAANAAVLSIKLSQMASGAIYTEGTQYNVIHEHKLETCEYIINNTNSPVLIAYHFKSDKDMLYKYLTEKNIPTVVFDGSPVMIRAWNARELKVMLIQPASAGHGLNLQQGGHTLIWYTLPSSLEEYLQTNARLYRQGQNEPVIIHRLLTKGTIDYKNLRRLEQKDLSEKSLLEAVAATVSESGIDKTTYNKFTEKCEFIPKNVTIT